MAKRPAADAERVPAAVRRAILPWYRKTPVCRRFLYIPRWAMRIITIPFVSLLFLLVTFPVWIWLLIPPAIAWALTVVEFMLAAVLCPVAVVFRRLRHAWPVEVIDWRGNVMERSYSRGWSEAGEHASALREKHRKTTHTMDRGSFLTRGELKGGPEDVSGVDTIGEGIELGLDIF